MLGLITHSIRFKYRLNQILSSSFYKNWIS